MLNLFQHLFITRFRNKFGMTGLVTLDRVQNIKPSPEFLTKNQKKFDLLALLACLGFLPRSALHTSSHNSTSFRWFVLQQSFAFWTSSQFAQSVSWPVHIKRRFAFWLLCFTSTSQNLLQPLLTGRSLSGINAVQKSAKQVSAPLSPSAHRAFPWRGAWDPKTSSGWQGCWILLRNSAFQIRG